jgi:hypothetical protein
MIRTTEATPMTHPTHPDHHRDQPADGQPRAAYGSFTGPTGVPAAAPAQQIQATPVPAGETSRPAAQFSVGGETFVATLPDDLQQFVQLLMSADTSRLSDVLAAAMPVVLDGVAVAHLRARLDDPRDGLDEPAVHAALTAVARTFDNMLRSAPQPPARSTPREGTPAVSAPPAPARPPAPAAPTVEELVGWLIRGADRDNRLTAPVKLLAEHRKWLELEDFRRAAIRTWQTAEGPAALIDYAAALGAVQVGRLVPPSDTAVVLLQIAAMIATSGIHWGKLDGDNTQRVLRAIAGACGYPERLAGYLALIGLPDDEAAPAAGGATGE